VVEADSDDDAEAQSRQCQGLGVANSMMGLEKNRGKQDETGPTLQTSQLMISHVCVFNGFSCIFLVIQRGSRRTWSRPKPVDHSEFGQIHARIWRLRAGPKRFGHGFLQHVWLYKTCAQKIRNI